MRMMSAPASASIMPANGAGPEAGQLDDADAVEGAAHRAPPAVRTAPTRPGHLVVMNVMARMVAQFGPRGSNARPRRSVPTGRRSLP